jgi:hypothetical protein
MSPAPTDSPTPPAGLPAPSDAARPTPPNNRRRWIAVASGTVILLGLLTWLIATRLPAWLAGGQPPEGTAASSATTGAAAGRGADSGRRIKATLFYVTADGRALSGASRDVAFGATPTEQARHIVEAQVQAPPSGTRSAIPAGTTVRAVFLSESKEAYVDLGGAITTGHTGGSLDEALAIYAIVNAVTVNLPEVTAVQILIEGREVDTLAGHIDLRYPLGRAPEWVQKGQ